MSYVIPPNQEALLARLLEPVSSRRSMPPPTGSESPRVTLRGSLPSEDRVVREPRAPTLRLRSIQVWKNEIRLRYAIGSREVRVRLVHPSRKVDGPQIEAGPFLAVLVDAADAPGSGPLMAFLSQRLPQLGKRFRWQERRPEAVIPEEGDPRGDSIEDLELLAVLAGIKPALRLSVEQTEVAEVIARLTRHELSVHRNARIALHDGIPCEIVCASKDPAHSRRLAELERTLHDLSSAEVKAKLSIIRDIGQLLGYPACCIEAHARRFLASPGELSVFGAANDAWCPAPRYRLNQILAGHVRPLISFEPCRFDCEPASERANAVAEELATRDPRALTQLENALRQPIVIHRNGARGYAVVRDQSVVDARPVERTHRGSVTEEDRQALATLRGPVDAKGRVADGLLLRFDQNPQY
ncbi:MAG: hypothetical protein AAGE52_32675 [Myxococcota bacterium]